MRCVVFIVGCIAFLASGCATSGVSIPDPGQASEALRHDLSVGVNEICFSVGEQEVAELADQLGWQEALNPTIREFGSVPNIPDSRAWQSPNGVYVYNQIGLGDVCTINVFGDDASVAAEIVAMLMMARPEPYTRRTGPNLVGGRGFVRLAESRTYLFDVPVNAAPPVAITLTGNSRLGPSMAMTVSNDLVPD